MDTGLSRWLTGATRFFLKLGGVFLVTWVLLEVVTRLLWLSGNCISVLDKEICLLPRLLLSSHQIAILDQLREREKQGTIHVGFDPILGWAPIPKGHLEIDGILYQSNDIGVRALRNYTKTPPEGTQRIAVFGPSFAYGHEVSLQNAWTYLIEQSLPNVEVMNWAVGGYGTDQALLRYETYGAEYAADVVIIAYEQENLRRNVNRFVPFYIPQTLIPLTKPVFVLHGEQLELVANPFPSLQRFRETALESPNSFLDLVCNGDFFCVRERYQTSPLDMLYGYRLLHTIEFSLRHLDDLSRPYTWQDSYSDTTQTETTLQLLLKFAEEAQRNGSVPVILVFPQQDSIELQAAGRATVYAGGMQLLRSRGVRVLDLAPYFIEANAKHSGYGVFFASQGHYNEAGNSVVSKAVTSYLCGEGVLSHCKTP
jgi:hypothetical protein